MISIKFNRKKIKKLRITEHSRTSKIIIIFVIVAIFAFTGIAMWIQYRTNIELSPTLITCFYGFCTGELWMLASIKKSKLSNGQKGKDYDYSQQINNIVNEINSNDDDNAKG